MDEEQPLRFAGRKPIAARGDDGDHAQLWGQIHQHDGRLRQVERDCRDLRLALAEMNVSLAVAVQTMKEQAERFDAKLTEQFLRHEAREAAMQIRIMIYGVGLLIPAMGALAWYVLSHLKLAA